MSSLSLVLRVARYDVLSLDMWGHVPADCCAAYDCPCITSQACCEDGEPTEIHDIDACDCHEDMNNRHKVGRIQVRENDPDSAILQTLLDDEFLSSEGFEKCSIEDTGDGSYLDVVDTEGRRIFQLQLVEGDD